MRHRLNSEDGFTLIELLVVILIIGILAGIALPLFAAQRDRGRDAAAKSLARHMETHVEACFTDTQDYTACNSQGDLPSGVGITVGSRVGEVEIIGATPTSYTLMSHSSTGSTYSVVKVSNGAVTRTCNVAQGKGDAGCKGGKW